MKKRTKGRDYAFQLTYSAEITEADVQSIQDDFRLEYPDESGDMREFGETLFAKAAEDKAANESVVRQFLNEKWTYERLGVTEKCILRLALTELFKGDAPTYAIMNDYVGLAKEYGDDKSAAFINGILESIRTKFSIERGNERRTKREECGN